MNSEKFGANQGNESRSLNRQEISDRMVKLRQSGLFDEKVPGHVLIDVDATCAAVVGYLESGDLEAALTFFDHDNPGPEVEAQFNGITGRLAFAKILTEIGMPVPDVLRGK